MKVKAGIDPLEERAQEAAQALAAAQAAKVAGTTFRDVAAAYIAANEDSWRNPKHRQQWRNTLETYVYPVIGDAAEIPARILDRHESVGIAVDQFAHRLGHQIGHCPPGDVVEHDRQVAMFRQMAEMRDQPGLARPVVIGRDAQPGSGPRLARKAHVQQRILRIVAAAAGDHRHAPGGLLDADLDHPVMLRIAERGGLAGRAARDERARALLDLPVDQLAKGRLVERPIAKRTHQSRNRT